MGKAKAALQKILRQTNPSSYSVEIEEQDFNEFNIAHNPLSADDWMAFKRKFVLEYNHEPVQPTGMTHSEFLNYIKTSGYREGDEFSKSKKLRDLLRELDRD